MKFYFLALSATVLVVACNNSPKAVETTTILKSDTTFVVQPELPVVKEEVLTPAAPVEKKSLVRKSPTASNPTSTNSGAASGPSSTNTSTEKKGWSKTAKGAVIGGVVGAGTGAIVNKKNRAAGAVIGGVLGAGTGAVIGNEMDKKDGRH
ncbi:MAG TPA: glycine zipper domain-containing protein [Flavisolibacter sp.]|jgi:hypothetical protein|nr:glycine zipper domain-containing protein [Flavisolibacter sp.]